MSNSQVRLSVPPEATYARSVRMMAANLAVVCSMNVEEVEDARMVAEEAFVYACATSPHACEITFDVASDGLHMDFSLGAADPTQDPATAGNIELARILLEAVSDSCEIASDGTTLRVAKLVGGVYDAS